MIKKGPFGRWEFFSDFSDIQKSEKRTIKNEKIAGKYRQGQSSNKGRVALHTTLRDQSDHSKSVTFPTENSGSEKLLYIVITFNFPFHTFISAVIFLCVFFVARTKGVAANFSGRKGANTAMADFSAFL